MQRALSGSLMVHAAVLGIALVGFSWSEPEDAPAAEAVNVSIISMLRVSANATEVVQSDSTANLVSSGVTEVAPSTIEPIKSETVESVAEPIEPMPVDDIEPVEPRPQEPAESEPQPPVEVDLQAALVEPAIAMTALSSPAISSLASQPVVAPVSATIEPRSSQELRTAPIPQMLSFERTGRPTYPKPTPEPPQQTPRPVAPQPIQSGNSGANDSDAVAAAGSTAQQAGSGNGGDAEVAQYPGDVLRKLRRALRSTNGPRGEVVVRFTVLADGRVSGVSIGSSSGNAAVDQAGLATVSRAAPFPPIPPGANRSDWTFDVPLAFGG
jgi:periplasmic protein TonB